MKKTVLIFSGGMDSTVLLHDLRAQSKQVIAVSFDYGQKHRKELDSARQTTARLSIKHTIVDIRSLFYSSTQSALTNPAIEVPDARYASENMNVTVVPNRNMIFLSVAASIAINEGASEIAYGAHSGDHFIYADCRKEFVDAMAAALNLCHDSPLSLSAPYLSLSKAEICRLGATLEVPFKNTWSCYKGQEVHCGSCGTCIERREAFVSAQVPDPTQYA